MEKQTKVRITLVVIPIVIILLIAAIVFLIITINNMQADNTKSKDNTSQAKEVVNNTSTNLTNETNTTNSTNTADIKKSKNSTNTSSDLKIPEQRTLAKANKGNTKSDSARDALTMALSSISSDYYAGDYSSGDSSLQDTLVAEVLEEETPEYIYEVKWDKNKTKATVRMQLANDDTSPIYRAEVSEQLTIDSFEEEEEE